MAAEKHLITISFLFPFYQILFQSALYIRLVVQANQCIYCLVFSSLLFKVQLQIEKFVYLCDCLILLKGD